MSPKYDTAAVLGSLNRGFNPLTVKLSPQVTIPGYRSERNLLAFLNSPLFLALAIFAMVAVLAWALFRAGMRIKRLPPEEV